MLINSKGCPRFAAKYKCEAYFSLYNILPSIQFLDVIKYIDFDMQCFIDFMFQLSEMQVDFLMHCLYRCDQSEYLVAILKSEQMTEKNSYQFCQLQSYIYSCYKRLLRQHLCSLLLQKHGQNKAQSKIYIYIYFLPEKLSLQKLKSVRIRIKKVNP